MKLVFFGFSPMWNKVLNSDLLKYLPKLETISAITTYRDSDFESLKSYDIIIPLLENDILQLYERNITKNVFMASFSNVNTLCCKFKFNDFMVNNSFQQYIPATYNNLKNITQLPVIFKRFNFNSGRGSFIIIVS